jgi:hypothetical protein
MTTIFVHSGAAHLDEIFAIAFLQVLLPGNYTIQRTAHPSPKRGDWIIDVGMELDPDNNKYDHHQDGSPDGLCAAGLLVKELRPDLFDFLMRDPFPGVPSWFKTLNLVDTKGPFAYKKQYGQLTSDAFGPAMTAAFGKDELWPIDFATQIVLEWLVKYENNVALETKAREVAVSYRSISQRRVAFIFESDNALIAAVQRVNGWAEQDPAIMIFKDDRGPGWAVLRRGDAPGIDFSKAEGDWVEFAHKGGFIMKTKAMDIKELLVQLHEFIV